MEWYDLWYRPGALPDQTLFPDEYEALVSTDNQPERVGLLLSRDLIFTTKITGTAQALGFRMLTAGGVASAGATIEGRRPVAIFVDLSAGDLVEPSALAAYRKVSGEATPFIAFGSHVDTQALDAARAAGCDPVLPRSKFSAELPELLRRYLSA